VFGFLDKQGEIQEEFVQLSTLGYLPIPSFCVSLVFILVNDTLMENTFLSERVMVKSRYFHS